MDHASWVAPRLIAAFSAHGAHADDIRFTEIPGLREFSGRMIVQPVPLEQRLSRHADARAAAQRDDAARQRLQPQLIRHVAEVDEFIVRVPMAASEADFARALMATGDYLYVEPDWRVALAITPNDEAASYQWQHEVIRSFGAWELVPGSEIICAICDTGVDLDHPDLAGALIGGVNTAGPNPPVPQDQGGEIDDMHGHGTFVAGCLAAVGNNGIGVIGGGVGFQLMPVRVTNRSDGTALISDITQGARWAVDNGAKIVNSSYEGVSSASVGTTGRYVRDNGGVLFWAAGNDGRLLSGFSHTYTVIVGSTDQQEQLSDFSNFGPPIDVVAPGTDVYSTVLGGDYGTGSGTSYASPIAASVGALVWSADETLTPDEVRAILGQSAVDLGPPGHDDIFGAGRIDAYAAVDMALNGTFVTPPPTSPPADFSLLTPASDAVVHAHTWIYLDWEDAQGAEWYIVRVGTTPDLDEASLVIADLKVTGSSAPILPETLLPDAVYFWSVEAANGSGGTMSSVGTFIAAPPPPACPGDIDGNDATGLEDFHILALHFGAQGVARSQGDLNDDTNVNLQDFAILAGDFGCQPD
jgi:subtilisin family serine protease